MADHRTDSPANADSWRSDTDHSNGHRTKLRLNALLEASLSLGAIHDPIQAMDQFLLMAMGWAGTTRGFLALADPWEDDGRLCARGLTDTELASLRKGISSMARDGLETTMGCPTPGHGSRLLIRNPPAAESSWPRDMELAVAFATDGCGPGMIGLGPKITDEHYSDGDAELLMAMTGSFTATLDRIRAARVISDLNADLNRRNERLRSALDENHSIRSDLDRQLFHLNAISGAIGDLSHYLRDSEHSVHTFLLTLCGVFGLARADLLLLDPAFSEPRTWSRGGTAPNLAFREAQDMLYACLESSSFQSLTPLSVNLVDPASLGSVKDVPEAYAKASLLALFRLDESVTGLLALGVDNQAGPDSSIPRETFLTLTNTFLLFLRNARSFQTITTLNRDLAQRNEELEKTLAELKASRKRIEVLERAKDQVRSVLERYTLRLGRPSWKDGVWMVAAGLVLGIIFNFSSPDGISLIPQEWTRPAPVFMSLDSYRESMAEGAILVDARPKELFQQGHAENALNISPSLFDFTYDMHLSDVPLETPIIVYGRTISSRYDEDIAYRLTAQGHEQVFVLPVRP